MRKAADGVLGFGDGSGCEVVRWNATQKQESRQMSNRVKDYRMTSRQHPKVLQAQSPRSLCLDNDFPPILASSLVNEVIAVSTVTLCLESSMDI